MQPLITTDDLRARFSIVTDINDNRLRFNIGAASRRLKKWVGENAYTDALSVTPQDAGRKEDLKNAEAHLTMHFAILGINSQITPKGMIKTARTSEGTATVVDYFNLVETRQMAQLYLETAEELAAPYIFFPSVQ